MLDRIWIGAVGRNFVTETQDAIKDTVEPLCMFHLWLAQMRNKVSRLSEEIEARKPLIVDPKKNVVLCSEKTCCSQAVTTKLDGWSLPQPVCAKHGGRDGAI